MRFERSTDLKLVRAILTDPDIYDRMGDDGLPPREEYQVPNHPGIWWVTVWDRERLLGLFAFFPENAICWATHVALFRGIHPRLTAQAGREIVDWVFANTPCVRLTASVPAFHRAALRFGKRVMGLKSYGRNWKSFLKGGALYDQILMGRSKGDFRNSQPQSSRL
jgi:hypothetical protein